MPDVDLLVRGTPAPAQGTTGTVSAVSDTATAVGDYLLVVADVDYTAAAGLTIQAATGVDTWTLLGTADDASTLVTKAWLGKVTAAGQRTVTVAQTGSSGLHVQVLTLNPSGGDVTLDGLTTTVDRATPFEHAGIAPAGSKDLLVCCHGQVQFTATTVYGAAPSGMTAVAGSVNQFSGLQTCWAALPAAGATGTRSQTSTPAAVNGGAGMMLALRSQTAGPANPTPIATYTKDATAATVVTDAFTPGPGELLVVKAATGASTRTVTGISGGSLSYDIEDQVLTGAYCHATIATARVGAAPAPMTVTVGFSSYSTGIPMSVIVERWPAATQIAATPASVSPKTGASGPPSTSITTTAADSAVTWVDGDYNGTTGARAYRGSATENYARQVSGDASIYSAWQAAPTPGSYPVGMTAPTGGKWSLVGIELLRGAPANVQATAALSGLDTLTVGAQQTFGAAAALSGADTLTVGAARAQPVAAALSAVDTLTAGAGRTAQVAAALTAVDMLEVNAGQQAAAALSSVDTLSVGAVRQDHRAAAALSGVDTLTAAAQQTHRAAAALSGIDTLTVGGTRSQPAAAALSGVDTLTVAGTRAKVAAAALAGQDSLTVGPVLRTAVVAAALSATNTLIARASVAAAGMLNPTVWALDPATGRLRPLPHVVKLQVDDVTNEVGAVTLDYPVFGRNWSLLRDYVTDERDLEVEVWLEGSRATRMVGRLDQRQGDDVTEGAVWSFSGTLVTGRLDEGVVAPQPLVGETTLGADVEVLKSSVTTAQWSRFYALGYRTTDEAATKLTAPQKVVDAVKANAVAIPQLADPKREAKFSSATPGAILLFLLQQCWGRGALTDLTVDFTAAKDSSGTPWPEVLTAKWSPGVTLLQVAQRVVELGLLEFTVTPDRVLRCWRFGGRGTNRTSGPRPVTLRRGQNLLQAGRRQGVRGAGTRFFVAGGEGAYTSVEDLNAQAGRGRVVEVASSVGNIVEPGAVAAAAQRTRAAGVRGQDERTFALALGVGMPRPGKDLAVGDTVRVDTAGTLGTGRVAQWTVALDAGSQLPAAQVTTGDLIRSRAAALLKRLQDTASGDTVIGTSQPSEDRGVPAAPTGLVVASAAYVEGQDVYAAVTAGWAAVQVNTDGTATTDLASYRVEWRLESRPGEWQAGCEVDAQRTSGSWVVGPAIPIRVRVQAIDRSGNRSAWSPEVLHLTEDDATPPSVPSTLVGQEYLGTARWTWDGKTSSGADMITAHPDFSHVELWMGTSGAFADAALVTNLYARGTWTVADLAYGTTVYAWLVSVDLRGNRSSQSGRAQATPDKLVQIDVGPNAIGRAQIIDGEIVNAKIASLAVNDGQVMNLSVGKLTAGIMSADVVVAGIFRTALSGSRAEFDNAGVRLYDSTGAIRVNLASATGNALFTGEIRSAMSGKRFVINALGSNPDEIRFYPSSTNQFGRLKTLTSDSTTYNGQAGITMKGYSPRPDGQSGEVSVFPGHARLAWANEMDGTVISSSIGAEKHQVGIGAPRVQIGAQSGTGEGEDAVVRIGVLNNAGTAFTAQATMQWDNGGAYGFGRILVPGNNCGFQFNAHSPYNSVSVINNANDLIVIFASNFLTSSDSSLKTDVVEPEIDLVAAVLAAPVRSYRLHDGTVRRDGKPAKRRRREFGLMADELPADLVTLDHNGKQAVDVYGVAALNWGATAALARAERDLARRVEKLEERLGAA